MEVRPLDWVGGGRHADKTLFKCYSKLLLDNDILSEQNIEGNCSNVILKDIDLATLQLLCKKCGLHFCTEYCIDLLSGVTSSRLSCDLAILGPRFEMIQLSTVHIHETEKDTGKNGNERNEAEIKTKMRGESLDQSRGWRGRLALTEASLWCPLGNIATTWQTVIIMTPQHYNCCVCGQCCTQYCLTSNVW